MMKTIMSCDKFYCPCCGEEIQIEVFESETGLPRLRLFHNKPEVSPEELQNLGIEFGIIPNRKDGE